MTGGREVCTQSDRLQRMEDAIQEIRSTLNGDGNGDPGIKKRFSVVEGWVLNRRFLEKFLIGTLVLLSALNFKYLHDIAEVLAGK